MSEPKPTYQAQWHEIISELIRANRQDAKELGRGLRLAYTPEDEHGVFRLCLSRKGEGKRPSEFEGETLWAHVCKAAAVKRPFVQRTAEFDERGAFVVEWVTGEQKALFGQERRGGYADVA